MPVADSDLTITAADLAAVRAWVGTAIDDADVDAVWVVQLNVELTALQLLRQRRADFVADPAQFAVQGDYSQNVADNLRALDAQIGQLERLTGTGASVVTTGVLSKPTGARVLRHGRRW